MGKHRRQATTGLDEQERVDQAIKRKAEEEEQERKRATEVAKALIELNIERRKQQAEYWVKVPEE